MNIQIKGSLSKFSLFISLAQKFLDIGLMFLVLVAVSAYYDQDWFHSRILILGFASSTLFLFLAKQNGLYKSWRTLDLWSEFQLIVYTLAGVGLGLLMLAFILKVSSEYSRLAIGTWALITPIVLFSTRIIVRKALYTLRKHGYNYRRIAILGNGVLAQQLAAEICRHEKMGIKVCGYFDDRSQARDSIDEPPELPSLGVFEEAIEAAKNNKYDELYIALPMRAEEKITSLIKELSDCSVSVHLVPDLFTFGIINSKTSVIGKIPTVSIYDSPLDDFGRIVKKIEDFFLSCIILLITIIPMIIIAIAIKLTSKGPVLFKQKRYGLSGEEITVWKFRSMTVAEDGNKVTQVTKNDVRVTPLGSFLRRTSLDELPQFFNVIQGKMSIVGPRPHAVVHNELYRKSIDGYMLRHLMKPGITGWAQINGWRGETDDDEKMMKRIEFDLDYIKNWSLRFDLKIIAMTVFKGFINKNAY